MQRLSVNVFDEHPAYFPTNQDIVYLIGNNGTGKSELLRTLKKHFEINKEEVLYFSDDRLFNLTSSQLAIFLMKHKEHKDSYLTKYGIDFELAMKSCKKESIFQEELVKLLIFSVKLKVKMM
jgi:ABC-type branched-subunit amino acid transport system ATPase component